MSYSGLDEIKLELKITKYNSLYINDFSNMLVWRASKCKEIWDW